ncbi:MAG: HEAT repeat domain-containing protein [Anaerolineae bacterium]
MADLSSLAIISCAASLLILSGCGMFPRSTPTPPPMEQLIAILEASDPEAPNYDPESDEFWFATSELVKLGPEAAPAAPALARALRYPRRDSYMAGKALVAIGPAAEVAIPELVEALKNDRPIVRRYAAFVLGIIGESSKCAVPEIAELLWDSDGWVRSAAAGALDAITGIDLVDETLELDPSHPGGIFADEPEGTITGEARTWWIEKGQYLDWSDESALCDPNDP